MSDFHDSQPISTVPHNLPLQLTSFIGREREIDQLSQLLGETRLLTLTGAGGVGKTRLCLEVTSRMLDKFEHGVWLVELGSVFEPQLVVHKASSTLGCRGEGSETRLEALKDYLHHKVTLLVLDNCEHLVQACAELVAGLLLFCPNLRVLASSREPLSVPGETVYEVPPLSTPDLEQPLDHDSLVLFEAVQLFIERARAFQPGFQVDNTTAPAIAQICHLLDGIPLAIELAAARVRVLSPSQIVDHLQDSLQFLSTGARTVTSRQRTLQASIDWSYALLGEREQILFRRLAIFAGEFLLEDVEAVCTGHFEPMVRESETRAAYEIGAPPADLGTPEALDLLSYLVDKSLVRAVPGRETIYRLLNPVQRFAWGKLRESGELDRLRDRHLNYYLELATRALPHLRSAKQSNWLERIELELDNFRAALDWSLQSGAYQTGMQLGCELGEFWWRQGYNFEGIEWLRRLLVQYQIEDITRARTLIQAGYLLKENGDYEEANSTCEDGLILGQKLEYQEGIAESLCLLGNIAHYYFSNLEKSVELLEQGVALYRQLGDKWNVAAKQLFLADTHMRAGYHQRSTSLYQECLAFFREHGDAWGLGFSLGGLGDLARRRGDYKQALTYFRESLESQVSLERGIEMGNKLQWAFVTEAIAITFIEQKRYQRAIRLWGFSEALRESIHSLLPPSYQGYYTVYLEAARAAIGSDAFNDALHEGRSLTLEQATALAMQPSYGELEIPSATAVSTLASSKLPEAAEQYGLTRREVEVLGLVASGLTDAQVAEKLYISPRTVSKHLQSIYSKIYVNSRSAATRFALEHHIA